MDDVFSLDTAAGPDYGDALVHTRVGGADLLGDRYGGVELLYALTSALLLTGSWLGTRRRRVAGDVAGADAHATQDGWSP